ncbi:RHS repeat domain-containing protein [Pseudomonas batumici]|uniref:YD repeat protein n=1 Tax=Pseudomonas batumici TaxID=226910 RepID=A0A0C2I5I6_9PSED|nr:RHS repeat-associated core domain-containing protein [Pseudomonas batumici]KIH84476.1 YD repeat protein [Pseudomonas batumici]
MALLDETLLQLEGSNERSVQVTTFTYHELSSDRVQYGRPLRESVTLNGRSTHTDYTYARLPSPLVGETVLRTTQTLSTSFDKVSKVIVEESSLLNGQLLLSNDDNDVQIRSTYDVLGRTLSETVAPGDPDYEATRHYSYFLVSQPQPAGTRQKAAQLLTDVKQVQTRTEFDGLNRPVYEERQDVDNPSRAGAFRQTYAAEYDGRGQLLSETEYDWLEDRDLALTTRFGYDDWGQQRSETTPDGVVTVTEADPIGQRLPDGRFLPTYSTWQQTSALAPLKYGHSVTHLNLFEKPDKIIRLTTQGQSISEQLYHYDGLGRTVEEIDALGHSTSYRYDAFDRMLESTLPGGDQILRGYALHSSEEWPETLDIQPFNQASPQVRAGEQQFDGLGRLTRFKVGTRQEHYTYQGSQSQVSDRLTARGHTLHYEYAPNLVESPISSVAPDEQANFDYDRKNARLTASTNNLGRREYHYDGNRQLKTEHWIANGKTWTTTYRNSLRGRQLHRLEVSGIATQSEHDQAGRLRQVIQGNVQSHFYYDALSRPQRTVSEDLATGRQLESQLTYDDHGRETLRTLKLSGHPTRTISQEWQADDQLCSRHLQMDGRSLLHETFIYDPRGRLVQHDCAGSDLPMDAYAQGIVRQQFRFDALDNMTRCLTTFADTSTDEARFIYDAADAPFLLTRATHTHPAYPGSVSFTYDDDGNMLNDERNRRLFYDSQGRLRKYEEADGSGPREYHYDGHDHLVSDTAGTDPETLRFYQGTQLSNTVQGAIKTQFLYGPQPLGQQQAGDASKTLLLMTNANQSVIAESQQDTLRSAVYSAYGLPSGDTLQSPLAFNGEACDGGTGWYLLGNGYRAYNPQLMRFHSPDSLSPFDSGGINPYSYCLGNPIAFSDPTGHSVGLVDWREPRHDVEKAILMAAVLLIVAGAGSVATINALSAVSFAAEAASGALNVLSTATGQAPARRLSDAFGGLSAVTGIGSGFGGGKAVRPIVQPRSSDVILKRPGPRIKTKWQMPLPWEPSTGPRPKTPLAPELVPVSPINPTRPISPGGDAIGASVPIVNPKPAEVKTIPAKVFETTAGETTTASSKVKKWPTVIPDHASLTNNRSPVNYGTGNAAVKVTSVRET